MPPTLIPWCGRVSYTSGCVAIGRASLAGQVKQEQSVHVKKSYTINAQWGKAGQINQKQTKMVKWMKNEVSQTESGWKE
jgi:hypothetical protein